MDQDLSNNDEFLVRFLAEMLLVIAIYRIRCFINIRYVIVIHVIPNNEFQLEWNNDSESESEYDTDSGYSTGDSD